MQCFIFGLGYVGTRLAQTLSASCDIKGTKRDPKKAGSSAYQTVPFDDHARITEALKTTTHLLITIPPVEGKDIVYQHYAATIKACPNLQWVGYLSTTGVYGDHGGAWVDESSACLPTTLMAKNRYHAEKKWLALAIKHHLPMVIFRLGAIYGPGPERDYMTRLLAGKVKKIHAPQHLFSRIHVDDIVQVLQKSMHNPTPGEIFNVVDDQPSTQETLYDYACDLLKKPPLKSLPLESAAISPMMRQFYCDRRQVKNNKIKKQFKLKLYYPSYKEGLQNLLNR